MSEEEKPVKHELEVKEPYKQLPKGVSVTMMHCLIEAVLLGRVTDRTMRRVAEEITEHVMAIQNGEE